MKGEGEGSESGRIRSADPASDEDLALATELRRVAPKLPERLETDENDIEAGVARLVLTLVEFIRQVLEHQAIRRMDGGSLTDDEVERLGVAMMRLQQRLDEIKDAFGLEGEDLNVDLGPLGRLL